MTWLDPFRAICSFFVDVLFSFVVVVLRGICYITVSSKAWEINNMVRDAILQSLNARLGTQN